jgi:DNA-binding transcriptional MerR regulator
MLTIGRLGKLAGIETKTLRYYDRVGLVRPSARTAAGYRLYDEQSANRLQFIRRSKALGMSLSDIRRILAVRDEGAAPCQQVLDLVSRNRANVATQIGHLETLHRDLRRLKRELERRNPSQARSLEECSCFSIIEEFQKRQPTTGRPSGSARTRGRRHG